MRPGYQTVKTGSKYSVYNTIVLNLNSNTTLRKYHNGVFTLLYMKMQSMISNPTNFTTALVSEYSRMAH